MTRIVSNKHYKKYKSKGVLNMRNKMKIIAVSLVMLLGIHICATSIPAVAASIDASGKTLLLIGQTYQD